MEFFVWWLFIQSGQSCVCVSFTPVGCELYATRMCTIQAYQHERTGKVFSTSLASFVSATNRHENDGTF